MNKETGLTLGSLFDGSGGFPLAGILAGVTPLWASEIEPFAVRVTTKRLPQMKHYGDVSQMRGADLPPVDIITFGSPCQDMSIAGRRDGLDGSRSSLFYEAIRIVKEMREKTNGEKPRFIVWENVPGAFSSNKGQDFKAVLEAVIGVKEPAAKVPAPEKRGWPNADYYVGDGWSVAYRVLDAQWWGVPQRRARIFLVADFAGQSAPEILFESEGVSGYTPQGFRSWQGAAGDSSEGSGETGGGGSDGRFRSVAGEVAPGAKGIVLNDQGGTRMDVTEEVTCTLRAEAHHPPVVLDEEKKPQAAGFCTEHSAKSRSIGYEEEKAPTLRAGIVPAAVARDVIPLEHHPTDSRIGIEEGNAIQTLTSRMGTGGNNVPLIMTPEGPLTPKTLKIRSGGETRCNELVVEDHAAQPVAFGISSMASNGMKSDNPKVGFYEAETSKTLDISGGNPSCNQGGVCVCEPIAFALQGSMIGRAEKNGPQGDGVNEDVSFTLNTVDHHAVAYSASKTSFFTEASEEMANTLVSSDYKDPPIVNDTDEPYYIVRRLTPVECARLQGFPDWWCSDLGTEAPTEEDIRFWTEVWETHRRVMGTSKKPKTEKQIIKWLKAPYSDSAEYRLWGNGVCLPIVVMLMYGIKWAADRTDPADFHS